MAEGAQRLHERKRTPNRLNCTGPVWNLDEPEVMSAPKAGRPPAAVYPTQRTGELPSSGLFDPFLVDPRAPWLRRKF